MLNCGFSPPAWVGLHHPQLSIEAPAPKISDGADTLKSLMEVNYGISMREGFRIVVGKFIVVLTALLSSSISGRCQLVWPSCVGL